jgi:hypothetical protein
MSRRTNKIRRIVPNMVSFLSAESPAYVCFDSWSLTNFGITEENRDGSLNESSSVIFEQDLCPPD